MNERCRFLLLRSTLFAALCGRTEREPIDNPAVIAMMARIRR